VTSKFAFSEMVGEHAAPDLALVLSLDVLESKAKNLVVATETTASHAEAATDPSKGLGEDITDIDIEEDNIIIRPTKPSHVDFRKSKIKEGHIEVLTRFDYIDNVEWVRLGGDDLVLKPKEDEDVIFRRGDDLLPKPKED
jgi:hypothetical protein